LTSLRTNIDLLAADARSGMLSEQDRVAILNDITGQLTDFTALIGDLVALARDETAASPEPIDFRDVVNAGLDRMRRRGFGLNFDVELIGDSDMLERAVTNLLDNAVKWSPLGGTVLLQLEGNRLRVADQGPASTKRTCRTSSTASIAATPPATPPAPDWGSHRGADGHHPARQLGQGRRLRTGWSRVHRATAGRQQPRDPQHSA
jgi:hypothetical protein